jgi:Protein of unknown function (DUF550)
MTLKEYTKFIRRDMKYNQLYHIAELMNRRVANAVDMQKLQDLIGDWQIRTFPGQSAKSKLRGAVREIKELLKDMGNKKEWADVLIYFLGAAHKQGIMVSDLLRAGNAKMKVNVKRKWGKPDRHGVYHHTCKNE